MNLQVRYARSFLQDMRKIDSPAYEQVYDFVFVKFPEINHLYEIHGLRQLGSNAIFYRFPLYEYIIAIEVTGQIIKFIRILPKPLISGVPI